MIFMINFYYHRRTITTFIARLQISDIAQFEKEVGDFIRGISPDTQFLDDRIVLSVQLPHRNHVYHFEMTILEEDGKLIVSPIVFGTFFHWGSKKVNIETSEVLNKVKYNLFTSTEEWYENRDSHKFT